MLGLLLALVRTGTAQDPDLFSFDGTVVHQTIEQGFFAINADNGQKFTPLGLPQEFAVDGLRVRVTARARDDAVRIYMYGALIEIVEISKLENPRPPPPP